MQEKNMTKATERLNKIADFLEIRLNKYAQDITTKQIGNDLENFIKEKFSHLKSDVLTALANIDGFAEAAHSIQVDLHSDENMNLYFDYRTLIPSGDGDEAKLNLEKMKAGLAQVLKNPVISTIGNEIKKNKIKSSGYQYFINCKGDDLK